MAESAARCVLKTLANPGRTRPIIDESRKDLDMGVEVNLQLCALSLKSNHLQVTTFLLILVWSCVPVRVALGFAPHSAALSGSFVTRYLAIWYAHLCITLYISHTLSTVLCHQRQCLMLTNHFQRAITAAGAQRAHVVRPRCDSHIWESFASMRCCL